MKQLQENINKQPETSKANIYNKLRINIENPNIICLTKSLKYLHFYSVCVGVLCEAAKTVQTFSYIIKMSQHYTQ